MNPINYAISECSPSNRLQNNSHIAIKRSSLIVSSHPANESINISTEYYALYSILADLAEQNKNITQLDSAQIATIRNISNGSSDIKFTAKSILSFVLGEAYTDEIEKEQSSSALMSNQGVNSFAQTASQTKTMILSPNPTNDVLNIQFTVSELNEDTQLIVKDILGHTIKTLRLGKLPAQYSLNLQDVPNGTYFCALLTNQRIIEIQKFTIIK